MVPTSSAVIEDLVRSQPPVRTVTSASMLGIVEELAAYHAAFASCFRNVGQARWSELYLRGLLIADVPRKNVEVMALRLLGAGEAADREVRALQHFLSEGVWDDTAVLRRHWGLVDETLGEDEGVLTVDGSDLPLSLIHISEPTRPY